LHEGSACAHFFAWLEPTESVGMDMTYKCYGVMAIVSLRKTVEAAAAYPTMHRGIGSTKFRYG
jgi:hypothetical protein